MIVQESPVRRLSIEEAADPGSDPVLSPETADGGPADDLVVLDLGNARSTPPDLLRIAARRLRSSRRIVVGVGPAPDRAAVPGGNPLLDAVTFTLTQVQSSNRGRVHPDRQTVPGDDDRQTVPMDSDRRTVPVDDVEAELARLSAGVRANPAASTVLVEVLAITPEVDVAAGLTVESLAYSTLLAGPEFARWLATRSPRRPGSTEGSPVRLQRLPADPRTDRRPDDEVLDIVLNDPSRRNAYSAAMREALIEALTVAVVDPTIASVRLSGAGPAFCSGGDLAEFGTGPGGPAAHFIRTRRSPGALVDQVRDRVQVRLHGACVGAGIEVPAFAGRVSAAPDVLIRLPEIGMGLIPGAGGTVSIPRRIGRFRAAYLALSGRSIGAQTALDWGLVDEIADRTSW